MNKNVKIVKPKDANINSLYNKAVFHIDNARSNVARSINTEMVETYWLIGRDIVEEEQRGKERAEYGSYILKELSAKLCNKYGKGFGHSTLADIRGFYFIYQEDMQSYQKVHAVRGQCCPKFDPTLSWTHYRNLMRVKNKTARKFYEIEAAKNGWSSRELAKQINSLLFERLLKSKDKKGLMQLACKGQEVSKPEDVIKEPLVLNFLNLPESHRTVESKLEQALIDNMQQFLLELGKGFCFVARQKRVTLEGDHFYVDLVFYHSTLNCYILIDVKTKKITHGDLGQMQFYVNYYDHEMKKETDLPTIGLVLCTEKNQSMVKYTLGEKTQQIFASKYQFHLPTEEELAAEVQRELKLIEGQQAEQEYE